jgi:N-acetylglutamate synthase-like GNAT family acetyltransferase
MAKTGKLAQLVIRRGIGTDIPALEQFLKTFVADGTLLPRTFSELEELIPNFFIAEVNGEIVGCAALEIYSRKLAEIRSLAVSHTVQGRGVGKRLVQACVALAQEQGVFEVMAISASDQFFKACGFDFTLPRLRKAYFLQTREEY